MKSIIKSERIGIKRGSGRCKQGRITVRGRGGGNKRVYKKVDFSGSSLKDYQVLGFEADSFRTGPLAIIQNESGQHRYILKSKNIKEGHVIKAVEGPLFLKRFTEGSRMLLCDVPLGQVIFNISSKPTNKSKFLRAAGSFGVVVRKEDGQVFVKMKTKVVKRFSEHCHCTIGEVAVGSKIVKTKAGHSRWLGRRPQVRGVAINPVDHPHGGGEGKGYVGRPSVSPWGKKAIGKKK